MLGASLKSSVFGIGVLELVRTWLRFPELYVQVITVIATSLNVVKYVGHVELFTECGVGAFLTNS